MNQYYTMNRLKNNLSKTKFMIMNGSEELKKKSLKIEGIKIRNSKYIKNIRNKSNWGPKMERTPTEWERKYNKPIKNKISLT